MVDLIPYLQFKHYTMKKLILLFTVSLILSCCNSDDDNNTETLPPATQTGAGTFACKVKGPY